MKTIKKIVKWFGESENKRTTRIRNKKWREENPEKYKQSQRKYYLKNKDRISIQQSEYRKKSKYYQKHREAIKASIMRWQKRNPEKVRQQKKKYYEAHKVELNRKRREYYAKYKWEKFGFKGVQGTGLETIRKKTLERDGYRCQNPACGKKTNETHHIDGTGSNRKASEQNNTVDNFITLCHRCHMRTEIKIWGCFSKGRNRKDVERNTEIYRLSKRMSQSRIARMNGLTRQRINQIVKKYRESELSTI